MYKQSTIRLLVIFAITFSLATIPGPLSSNLQLPRIQLAHANAASNNPWLPAGPALDRLITPIFTDQVAEFNNLQQGTPPGSGSSIDITDQQLTPGLITPLTSASQFLVTSPIKEHGYFDIEMQLSSTFWNCNFNFGNSTCGIHIRQGIAHLIDRQAFVANDANIRSTAVAVDNPVPIDNGGLPTSNPCSWDLLYPQTGSKCIIGGNDPTIATYTGGTAYRLAPAASGSTGAQPNPSLDFCAAAGHFIAAGVASGVVNAPGIHPNWYLSPPSRWNITSTTNCQLTGIISGTTPTFVISREDVRRLDLGNILASQICVLFTGFWGIPCTNLAIGPLETYPFFGFLTSPTTLQSYPWFYTAAFVDIYPFDSSLYSIYNSQFVSGFSSIQPPNGPCSPSSKGSYNAANYMYLCDPKYDSVSNQIETAPCLQSSLNNDINSQVGQTTPTYRDCTGNPAPPSTAPLTMLSAGLRSEDKFGRNAYSIPVFDTIDQFAYLNKEFTRVINSNLSGMDNTNGEGIANYYTLLNAWNPNPPSPGTIRQGISYQHTTSSVSPYMAEIPFDYYIVGSIYDKLGRVNPYNASQLFNYMTVSTNLVCNSASNCLGNLTYTPPAGTVATYRLALRNDIFFHDGRQLTSFDVAFSYLSLLAAGAFQSAGAASIGAITILSPAQFDFNLRSNSPTELTRLLGLSILPGRYWTGAGASAWDMASAACTSNSSCFPAQYAVNFNLVGSNGVPSIICNSGSGLTGCPFSPNMLNVNSNQIGPTYDPVATGILIGSGPWMCVSSTSVRGGGCTQSGYQNPEVGTSGYTLTRFGISHAPGTSLTDSYFRSSGNAALWFWSGDTGDFTHDFLNFGIVALCVGAPIGASGCTHWQQGIGGDVNGLPTQVQPIPQASIVTRFVGEDFVSVAADLVSGPSPSPPWTQTAIEMLAVGSANSFDGFPAPTLYEGTLTLNPASISGCSMAYPVGGYDC